MDNNLDIEEIFKGFREQIGSQAQEIALLKSMVVKLQKQLTEPAPSKDDKTNN